MKKKKKIFIIKTQSPASVNSKELNFCSANRRKQNIS